MRERSLSLELREAPGGLSFLQAPLLSDSRGLEHAFMTRVGGVSPAPFKGLNFGGDDSLSNISANMELLGAHFNLPPGGVATVSQIHGTHVVVMDKKWNPLAKRPCGDAIITAEPHLAIGILTADCVPVLLYDPCSGVIAAVHAGWRGLTGGALRESIRAMSAHFSVRPENISAAIGPHIGTCCYEVSEDLVHAFEAAGFKSDAYFSRRDSSIHLDLGGAVFDALTGLGLERDNISRPGPCTSCSASLYYSYRRDKITGRHLSFIMKR